MSTSDAAGTVPGGTFMAQIMRLNCYLILIVNNSIILWRCISYRLHFAGLSAEALISHFVLPASVHVCWCVSLHAFSGEQTASQQYGGRRQVGGVQREPFD